MQYHKLGTSDLEIPVVCFGAWAIGGWMWGGTDDAAALRALNKALDMGMTCIDTAPTYGMGHSETIVGQAIAGRRDEVVLATKCGVRWDLDIEKDGFQTTKPSGEKVKIIRHSAPDSVRYEIDQSLARLKVDVIDLYQVHWPDPQTPIADTMEALLDIQRQGKIRYIGVSNYAADMMEECLRHGVIVSNQPKYNPLEREIEADVLPFCREHDIGVLAYSPIAQGLMTGKVTMDREFAEGDARADRPWFQRANRRRVLDMLARLQPIADGHGITLAQMTIAWVVQQDGVTAALVGARDEAQVEENVRAGDVMLSDEELRNIRDEVEALGKPE